MNLKAAIKKTILTYLFLLPQNLMAHFEPHPFQVAVQAEFLYWNPYTENQYFFTTTSSATLTDNYIAVTNFHPAFRVIADYVCDVSNFIEVRFSYFNSSDTTKLFNVIGFDNITGETTPTAANASSQLDFTYNAVDLTLQNATHQFYNLSFSFLEGLNFAWINYRQFNLEAVTDLPVEFVSAWGTMSSRYWGIGPQLGIDMKYVLPWDNCSLTGNVRASLVISHLKTVNQSVLFELIGPDRIPTLTEQNINVQGNWLLSPSFDAKLGIDWHKTFRSFQAHAEVGYEFVWYRNAVQAALMALTIPVIERYDAGFQGPYFSCGISF